VLQEFHNLCLKNVVVEPHQRGLNIFYPTAGIYSDDFTIKFLSVASTLVS
jgi:hypothetical protein